MTHANDTATIEDGAGNCTGFTQAALEVLVEGLLIDGDGKPVDERKPLTLRNLLTAAHERSRQGMDHPGSRDAGLKPEMIDFALNLSRYDVLSVADRKLLRGQVLGEGS